MELFQMKTNDAYGDRNHRLPKLKSRLFDVFLRALRAADSTYVVYATACVYREMYGKITESLKSGK